MQLSLHFDKPNIKATVFRWLDKLPDGYQFSGWQIQTVISGITGKNCFPDTALRYIRMYRSEPGRRFVENVSRAKSFYRIGGAK